MTAITTAKHFAQTTIKHLGDEGRLKGFTPEQVAKLLATLVVWSSAHHEVHETFEMRDYDVSELVVAVKLAAPEPHIRQLVESACKS